MPSFAERFRLFQRILLTAKQLTTYNPRLPAEEYLQFCIRHGYFAYPTWSPDEIVPGDYLQPGRSGAPATANDFRQSLGIVLCFRKDAVPGSPPLQQRSHCTKGTHRTCIPSAINLLLIGCADVVTPVELALNLLDKAREARHYLGRPLQGLPRLDPEPLHESRMWKYNLDLLDACGGEVWHQAVTQEINDVINRYARYTRSPGDEYFAASGRSYSALDQFFGAPLVPRAASKRSTLVAMRANFQLAEDNLPPSELDDAYANVVKAFRNCSKRY